MSRGRQIETGRPRPVKTEHKMSETPLRVSLISEVALVLILLEFICMIDTGTCSMIVVGCLVDTQVGLNILANLETMHNLKAGTNCSLSTLQTILCFEGLGDSNDIGNPVIFVFFLVRPLHRLHGYLSHNLKGGLISKCGGDGWEKIIENMPFQQAFTVMLYP